MICSTTYRSALSLAGAMIMTLGTFSMLQASAPWESHRSEIVRYHDTDLNRPANATRVYARIHSAAEKVCEPLGKGLAARAQFEACVEGAIADAVAKVNRPELDAVHSATIGGWRVASERSANPRA
jgi:UrcA family protein